MTREELRVAVERKTLGKCSACGKPFKAGEERQKHHAGLHDTKGNNKNYPLSTQSIVNQIILHNECHKKNPSFGRWPVNQAEEIEALYRNWVTLIESCPLTEEDRRGIEADMRRIWEERK